MNIYGLAVLVSFVLAALKLAGVVAISWLGVFIPVLLALAIALVLAIVFVVGAAIVAFAGYLASKR